MATQENRLDWNKNWKTFRNKRGWVSWYQPFYECFMILMGKQSLHRAWQAGYDYGTQSEYQRIVINGGR